MSYNISTWKQKKMINLKIPIASFFEHERVDWHPERVNNDDGSVTIKLMSGEISGRLEDDWIHVDCFEMHGEGSGTETSLIIEPALKQSKGELEVVRILEGGDSIDRLIVKDGDLTTERVEL